MHLVPDSIFDIKNDEEFNNLTLTIFKYQYEHLRVYKKFCDALGRNSPKHYSEIPFLPISFFKTHQILSDEVKTDDVLVFKSSGTTVGARSQHYVANPKVYEKSFVKTFRNHIAEPTDSIILALLPNYIEQGNSSLVYMVNYLIQISNHPLSGFYLSDSEKLVEILSKAKETKREIILFGVTYTLLDFAEKNVDLSGVKIIETGGMKGRRKEIVREELHEILKEGLQVDKIYSEYGMTELLSQGYTDGSEYFTCPNWMKILIRDVNDPLSYLSESKTGGVNVIDLANIYSCSFIATDDLGCINHKRFKILGRFDQSDIRGCNLLIN